MSSSKFRYPINPQAEAVQNWTSGMPNSFPALRPKPVIPSEIMQVIGGTSDEELSLSTSSLNGAKQFFLVESHIGLGHPGLHPGRTVATHRVWFQTENPVSPSCGRVLWTGLVACDWTRCWQRLCGSPSSVGAWLIASWGWHALVLGMGRKLHGVYWLQLNPSL